MMIVHKKGIQTKVKLTNEIKLQLLIRRGVFANLHVYYY